MIVGAITFALIVFFLTVYTVNAIRDCIVLWRDLETLDRMLYRVGTVSYLRPHGFEIGVDFLEGVDHFPQQKSMGARESLVRSLEVGKQYIFVCVDRGGVCIAAWASGTPRSTPEQDLQLARKYYSRESLS